jgi:hypothetical protein
MPWKWGVTSRFNNLSHTNILEVRSEVLNAMNVNIRVCWDVVLWNWLNRYCSAGTGFIGKQSSTLKMQAASSSQTHLSIKLESIWSQKTIIKFYNSDTKILMAIILCVYLVLEQLFSLCQLVTSDLDVSLSSPPLFHCMPVHYSFFSSCTVAATHYSKHSLIWINWGERSGLMKQKIAPKDQKT